MATKINIEMICADCGAEIDLQELHYNEVEEEDGTDAALCHDCMDKMNGEGIYSFGHLGYFLSDWTQ
ncbi:hypothetical protein [Nitrosomonas marina]|uniref:Uncharacterized protein n=1 Tax=Nitrosomonas marina TaxID=917 RepID=A0A1H8J9H1_9PROT|nr:hypothetical protein [Nitrosomonas marina]SEN77450.1 hypothetical protein SAMN05216325_1643 [Nitrosomonas marina]